MEIGQTTEGGKLVRVISRLHEVSSGNIVTELWHKQSRTYSSTIVDVATAKIVREARPLNGESQPSALSGRVSNNTGQHRTATTVDGSPESFMIGVCGDDIL